MSLAGAKAARIEKHGPVRRLRRTLVRTALSTLLSVTLTIDALAAPCSGGAEQTVFGQWRTVPSASRELSESRRQVRRTGPAGTRYMRVLMEMNERGGERWLLSIRDADHHLLEVLGPRDFEQGATILSQRHRTRSLVFDLSSDDGKFPAIRLREEIIMPEAVAGIPYYSRKVEGVDDWEFLYGSRVSEDRRRWGDNVAFLMIGLNEGKTPGTCSGVVLAPGYVLTNWHCGPVTNLAGAAVTGAYWNGDICERTQMDLSWDDDDVSREFACVQVLAKSQDLDYVLLRIRALEGSGAIRPLGVHAARDMATVSMVHHPAASQKVISADCNILDRGLPSRLGTIPDAIFTHDCDTEGGSSGAPMFDNGGMLVGLHFHGFEIDGATGRCDRKNKAIWIDAILTDLKAKAAAGEDNLETSDVDLIESLIR